MFYLISGGSGSGKSEYAEEAAERLHNGSAGEFIYIATMMAFDQEAEEKIKRHRLMRKGKGFTTLECFTDLKNAEIPEGCTILLDCLSNLTANEMFDESGSGRFAEQEIILGVSHLLRHCKHLVIVTNEVFSDGCRYDDMTIEYIKCLGRLNRHFADMADVFVEIVYGIPVEKK